MLCHRGANHYNQTDILFVLPKFITKQEKFRSTLDPVIAHGVNLEICHAFLKRNLLLGKLLVSVVEVSKLHERNLVLERIIIVGIG